MNDTSIDVALDMTFLALGASGGAFTKRKVAEVMTGYFGEFIGAVLIVMLGIAAFLLYHRRFSVGISERHARTNIILGFIVCGIVAVVAYPGA